jgi:hypothetical protein
VNLTKKIVLADLITQGEDYFAYRVIQASNLSYLVMDQITIKKPNPKGHLFLKIDL